MIDLRFFQAAATALPTLVIAAGFASSVLDPTTRRTPQEQMRLLSKPVIATFIVGTCWVITAEVVALVTLAANRPTRFGFVLVLGATVIVLWELASMAVYRIVEPLAGTALSGKELLLFLCVACGAAIIACVVLFAGG